MVVRDEEDFDVTTLLEICANWPERPIPEATANDPLLERARQILSHLTRTQPADTAADLIPLVRHILLRAARDETEAPWLRVPTISGWPAAADWRRGQFEVLSDVSGLRVQPNWPRLPYLDIQADLFDDAFKELESRPRYGVPADPLLIDSMGLPTYTGNGQREAVRALLQLPADYTLIANLPTGSGKSLLAQIPPLVEAEGMMTLAIVPTVALAIDQASRMRDLLKRRHPHRDYPPLAFHGGLTLEKRSRVHSAIRRGEQPILFTSPEYALGSLRGPLQHAATEARLTRVFIDEAHLVIGWGNGFRPAFQLLPALVRMLRANAPSQAIRVVLASATLTDSTLHDLRILFGPPERVHTVSAVHLRPELRYATLFCDEIDRLPKVAEVVALAPRPFILYVTRPQEADLWLRTLREIGLRRVDKFSGATSSTDRARLLRKWAANELDGMVATSAFGLGVDKNDVRTIIHATLPESLDRYYQEVGRAGRDGRGAAALMLHTQADEDQARGLAFPKLLGDENAHERWSGMIVDAQPHEAIPEVVWVDLTRLPSHLHVKSEASLNWSTRTLTLMARAGLIELVAMESQSNEPGETPLNFSDATRAAVRILSDGHLHFETFTGALSHARQAVRTAAGRGLNAIIAVANGKVEVSEALQQMYSVSGDIWVPVTKCCGGCQFHWSDRQHTIAYAAPQTPRLPYFAPRSTAALEQFSAAHTNGNVLVVTIDHDDDFPKQCAELIAALLPAVKCHTVAWDRYFQQRCSSDFIQALPPDARVSLFFDTLDSASLDSMVAGENEVRITIWTKAPLADLWDQLLTSSAQMELLILPSDRAHPHHQSRKFLDTTSHVRAANLLQVMSS